MARAKKQANPSGSRGRRQPLLIEIGTEELPPKSLKRLSEAFGERLRHHLINEHLLDPAVTTVETFATPRRLAVLIPDVRSRQQDQQSKRLGPSVQAAFDATGKPTGAAIGFAKSCGVALDALAREETDKGPRLVYIQQVKGQAADKVIPLVLERAIKELPVAKRMRWGDLSVEFVRPVHWLVVLHGKQLIKMDLLSVTSDRKTRGHRFHHPGTIALDSAASYAAQLEKKGGVIASFVERRARIAAAVTRLAAEIGGSTPADDELLDEVTGLVESPHAILGGFDKRFLEVPKEALVTTMRNNQKYFPVVNRKGGLLPHFITISNIKSKSPAQVRAGNERVLRARFSDARFFWDTDRKVRLEQRVDALRSVVFHVKLGTLFDKTGRVQRLAVRIAEMLGANRPVVQRAALLAKTDLMTAMVGEFPTLQGTMGRYYAAHDGEAAEVAVAMEEQYLPRFAGDVLPTTAAGQALAIAERLDTLVGIFGIGELPTGDKDPFALRRAALGVLRTIIEQRLDLDLAELLDYAVSIYDLKFEPGGVADAVFSFMMERLRAYYHDAGIGADVFEAVLTCRPTRPRDFDRRVRAVEVFRGLPEAASLTAANKRIANILRQANGAVPGALSPELLQDIAERELVTRMVALAGELAPLLERGDYQTYLVRLARIRDAVDTFFDSVLVMVDNEKLRNNRLALLAQTRALFLRIADLSCLQG
ncbi:MAG: glycyl-tRNA synthetase beta chain [Gammaproteobacteria bacterium]|nr:MAG: glycyl-tRNA synthetase beta chain [Gammaproteobacteria bacterium]TND06413.1 MAG: glycyl-tRNA synthetase beta chain [Gammaproteobacteria bacterium]